MAKKKDRFMVILPARTNGYTTIDGGTEFVYAYSGRDALRRILKQKDALTFSDELYEEFKNGDKSVEIKVKTKQGNMSVRNFPDLKEMRRYVHQRTDMSVPQLRQLSFPDLLGMYSDVLGQPSQQPYLPSISSMTFLLSHESAGAKYEKASRKMDYEALRQREEVGWRAKPPDVIYSAFFKLPVNKSPRKSPHEGRLF